MATLFNCTAYGRLGKCCRYSFYSSNVLAIVTCLSAAGAGIWVIGAKKSFSALFEPKLYVNVAFILLIVGGISVLLLIIGCYATNRELRCLMCSFSVASLVMFLMLLIAGVMGFVFQMQLKKNALDLQMLTALQNLYGQSSNCEVTKAFDLIQEQFLCCGVNNNKDENYMIWRTAKWHMDYKGEPKKQVPMSCCVFRNGNYVDAQACQFTDLQHPNSSVMYMEGCYDRFSNDLLEVSTIAGCFGIAASISMLPPALFAALLAKLIQK